MNGLVELSLLGVMSAQRHLRGNTQPINFINHSIVGLVSLVELFFIKEETSNPFTFSSSAELKVPLLGLIWLGYLLKRWVMGWRPAIPTSKSTLYSLHTSSVVVLFHSYYSLIN